MSLLDKLLNKLGYVKQAASPVVPTIPTIPEKPSSHLYPEDSEDNARQLVLDEKPKNKELVSPSPVSSAPEQLSGDPRIPGDENFYTERRDQETTQFPTPEQRVMGPTETGGGMTTDQYASIVTNLMNTPRVIDVEEIDKQNHAIAMKMRKAGIVSLDRDIFEAKYLQIQKKAALAKKSLSDYIEEIL